MSSNDLENDIKPEIPAKRVKFDDKDSDEARRKLSVILQREIETEIKLRKNDLDTIEENIFLTKQCLLRLKQGVVTDYYKEKSQKEYLQYPPHPAIKDTFLGKSPRGNIKTERNVQEDLFIKEEIKDNTESIVLSEEQESISEDNSKPLECPKPPCYIPPKPVKVETVKPQEPRGYVSKKHLRIVVGNVSKWLAPKECAGATHKWTVYTKSADPDVDLSEFVSKVVFFLHPSYKPNDVISVTEPPFKLTRRGWGEFPLKARFHFKNSLDLPVDVMHVLKLDHKHTGLETFGSETTLAVWIHLPAKEEPISLHNESVKEEVSENLDFLDTKSSVEGLIEENNSYIFEQDDVFQKNDAGLNLDEKNINKNNLDELNSSFTKEDIESFLLDETNLANFSLPGDFLNSLADEEYKNVHLPNFIGNTSQNNSIELKHSQLEYPGDESEFKNSSSSVDPQPSDDFLEECNFVESEVVIDCDNESAENLTGSEELVCVPEEVSNVQDSYEVVDEVIYENNCDSTENNDFSHSLSKTTEISDENSILDSQLKNTTVEITSSPYKHESNCEAISEERNPISKCDISSNILQNEINSQKLSKININNGLLAKSVTTASCDTPNSSFALKKVLIQSSPGIISNSVKINKNILKGKVITIVKSSDKSFNILGSKVFPKQVLLSALNGSKQPILNVKKNDINKSTTNTSSPGDMCAKVSSVCIPKPEIKWTSIKGEVPRVCSLNNEANPSEIFSSNGISTQGKSVFVLNSLPTKSSNLAQKAALPISNLILENKKKKKTASNKEVKSTVITLQKENGQVILRKEAKFKECKESIASAILTQEKPQARDLKLQNEKTNYNTKIIALDESNSAVISVHSLKGNTKSPLFKVEMPQPSSNNSPVGEKKVLLVSQKNFKFPCKPPLAQKIVAPISLLKQINQEASKASTRVEEMKDPNKEGVLLKRCPTQNTEIAVSWLIKRFPLVDSRAQLSGFRSKHPYCAKSRDDFLNWPFPKQRAAEWMRAKAVGKILEKLPGIAKWSTLEIWDWARIRAFTPMRIDSDLKDPPVLPDTQYFYTQPTEEIIDFIRRCKDLKEKEVVDVTSTDVSHSNAVSLGSFSSSVTSKKTGYKFNLTADKDETPFEPELQGMRTFINKCKQSVGAATSPEPLCPGILYASADRVLISAFYSVAEDIIRRAHNSSWIRHSEKSPSEVSVGDVKSAILSRKEFDFLVPSKTEKKERPPVTILPNFS